MSVLEWLYEIVVEGAKYVVIGHWFFGYEFNKKKTRYLLALYPLLMLLVQMLVKYGWISGEVFVYKIFWGLLVVLCAMQGELIDKM